MPKAANESDNAWPKALFFVEAEAALQVPLTTTQRTTSRQLVQHVSQGIGVFLLSTNLKNTPHSALASCMIAVPSTGSRLSRSILSRAEEFG